MHHSTPTAADRRSGRFSRFAGTCAPAGVRTLSLMGSLPGVVEVLGSCGVAQVPHLHAALKQRGVHDAAPWRPRKLPVLQRLGAAGS